VNFCVNGLMANYRRVSSSAMNGCLSAAVGFVPTLGMRWLPPVLLD